MHTPLLDILPTLLISAAAPASDASGAANDASGIMGFFNSVFGVLVVVIVLGLVATSKPFYRLRRKRAIAGVLSTGWPGIVVGLILGPSVFGVIQAEPILDATPLLMMGLGWIGVMVGLQLRKEIINVLPARMLALTGADALASLVVFGLIAFIGLGSWVNASDQTQTPLAQIWGALLLLSAGGIGWTMETRSLRMTGQSPSGERLALAVRTCGALGAIAAIAIFGIITNASSRGADGVMELSITTGAIKLGIALVLAVLLGVLGRFCLTLAGRHHEHQLVVFLGLVVFAAGVAAQVGLSPLFVAMLAGVMLANIPGPDMRLFERFIIRAEHTVAIFFSLLAGLLLDPHIGAAGLTLALALAAGRLIYKPLLLFFGLRFGEGKNEATAQLPPLPSPMSAIYLGAARQGPVAIALGVGLVLAAPSPFHKQVLAVLVLAGITCEFIALTTAQIERKARGAQSEMGDDQTGGTA